MATILIRNASLFSPDPLGTNDILIINDRIAAIAQNVSVPEWLGPVQEMDGKGLFAVPGFIDAHVHITGGGGEAGFSSQVPPLPLSKLIRSGVTTVGGLLGTDGVTRHVDSLFKQGTAFGDEARANVSGAVLRRLRDACVRMVEKIGPNGAGDKPLHDGINVFFNGIHFVSP